MSKLPTYISLIFAAILWAGATVAAKIGLREFTPIWLSALRFLVAIPVLILKEPSHQKSISRSASFPAARAERSHAVLYPAV